MDGKFWKSAIWAGIIAGIVMLILEMVMNPLFLGISMWSPSRMIGAIILGKGVLPPPDTFDAGILLAASAVHFPLSVVYSILIGLIVRNTSDILAMVGGAVIGLAIYFMNFYLFTSAFPWFENARNWVQIVIHILFGLTAAWSFFLLLKKESGKVKTAPDNPAGGTTAETQPGEE